MIPTIRIAGVSGKCGSKAGAKALRAHQFPFLTGKHGVTFERGVAGCDCRDNG